MGRCKQQQREKLSPFWGLQKVIFAVSLGGEPGDSCAPTCSWSAKHCVFPGVCQNKENSCTEWGLKDARVEEKTADCIFLALSETRGCTAAWMGERGTSAALPEMSLKWHRDEVFQLKGGVSTTTNGNRLAVNSLKLQN